MNNRVLIVVNKAGFYLSHRREIGSELVRRGYEVSLVAPFDSAAEAELEKDGLKLIEWKMNRSGKNPLNELKCFLSLCRIYKKYKPALVHHVTQKPVLYGSLAARITGVRRVINAVSGMGSAFISGGLLSRCMFLAHKVAHAGRSCRTIFQNRDDLGEFVSRGMVRRSQSRLIRGSGVDPNEWIPAHEGLSKAPVVIVVCRMLYDKGIREAVEAASILQQRGVKMELHLVGGLDPDNPRAIPEKQLLEWTQSSNVKWLGEQEDVLSCLQFARIACLPSYREGLPRSLLEAASCGLPIVTTNVPGCREIVINGYNGTLVTCGDSMELAEALSAMLHDADLCKRYGENGRQMIINECSIDKVVADHMLIYKELLLEHGVT